jgi:hypothetical protein
MVRLSTTHRRKTVLLGVLCTSHPDRHAFGQYSEYGTSQPIPAVGVSCNNNKERVTSPVSVGHVVFYDMTRLLLQTVSGGEDRLRRRVDCVTTASAGLLSGGIIGGFN